MGESLIDQLINQLKESKEVSLYIGSHCHTVTEVTCADPLICTVKELAYPVVIPVWISAYLGSLNEKTAVSNPINYTFRLYDGPQGKCVGTEYSKEGFTIANSYKRFEKPALFDMHKLLPLYRGKDNMFSDPDGRMMVSETVLCFPRAFERWVVMEEETLKVLMEGK